MQGPELNPSIGKKRQIIGIVGDDGEKLAPSYTVGGNIKLPSGFRNHFCTSEMFKPGATIPSNDPSLCIYPL